MRMLRSASVPGTCPIFRTTELAWIWRKTKRPHRAQRIGSRRTACRQPGGQQRFREQDDRHGEMREHIERFELEQQAPLAAASRAQRRSSRSRGLSSRANRADTAPAVARPRAESRASSRRAHELRHGKAICASYNFTRATHRTDKDLPDFTSEQLSEPHECRHEYASQRQSTSTDMRNPAWNGPFRDCFCSTKPTYHALCRKTTSGDP